jgi:hypothetical protein
VYTSFEQKKKEEEKSQAHHCKWMTGDILFDGV